MTTITIERELLEQALDALNSFDMNYGALWQSSCTPEQIDMTCSVIRAALAAPATDDRHRQELLAMEITLQNMAERHTQELAAYELTVANLRAELLKAKPVGKGGPFAYTTGAYSGRFTVEPVNRAAVIPEGVALYLHPPTPAWHDAPTVEGMWVNSISGRVNVVIAETLHAWQNTAARWYGPISPDTGNKS